MIAQRPSWASGVDAGNGGDVSTARRGIDFHVCVVAAWSGTRSPYDLSSTPPVRSPDGDLGRQSNSTCHISKGQLYTRCGEYLNCISKPYVFHVIHASTDAHVRSTEHVSPKTPSRS